ncbi:hypothetical protein Tco_0938013 [Tanacetum coccineum]|uniref:Uncharacterized protein n=1 Tax=Tanacetum coccineum TaxID=301880 RepID=A0ABQ5DHV6_9ASTR
MNYQPVTAENKANKTAGPEEANHSASTQDTNIVGNFELEGGPDQEHYVLPMWSSYTSTIKSSELKFRGEKPNEDVGSKTNEEPVEQVDQIFLEELERLKRQENNANDAAEALRKEFARNIEDLLLQAVAGKPVNISKASIRSALLFYDADGIDSLNNQAIFDAIQLMGGNPAPGALRGRGRARGAVAVLPGRGCCFPGGRGALGALPGPVGHGRGRHGALAALHVDAHPKHVKYNSYHIIVHLQSRQSTTGSRATATWTWQNRHSTATSASATKSIRSKITSARNKLKVEVVVSQEVVVLWQLCQVQLVVASWPRRPWCSGGPISRGPRSRGALATLPGPVGRGRGRRGALAAL